MIGRFFAHDHTDQFLSVSFGKCSQCFAGFVGITGLSSDNIFAGNFPGQKIVGVQDPEIVGLICAGLKMIVHFRHIFDKIGMFVDFPADQCYVVCAGVVVGVVESVGCHKVCILTAEFSGTLIHKSDKFFLCSGYSFSEGDCDLVGGSDHQTIQCFFHGDRFTDIHTDIGTSSFNSENSIFRESDNIRRLQIFIGKQSSHQFGDTCRVQMLVYVFAIKDSAALSVHDNSACGADRRPVGPGRIKICLNSLCLVSG